MTNRVIDVKAGFFRFLLSLSTLKKTEREYRVRKDRKMRKKEKKMIGCGSILVLAFLVWTGMVMCV